MRREGIKTQLHVAAVLSVKRTVNMGDIHILIYPCHGFPGVWSKAILLLINMQSFTQVGPEQILALYLILLYPS